MAPNVRVKMKQLLIIAVIAVVALGAGCQKKSAESGGKRLTGVAEDLWGNRVDLADYTHGLTLIEPYSPST